MNRLIRCAAVALMLFPAMGSAQDYDAGLAAANPATLRRPCGNGSPLAEQGDAMGQVELGGMYYLGLGVPQDYAEAMKWLRLAAEQGNVSAQDMLGGMYEKGLGVPQDYITAHMWFNLAAATGDMFAGRDKVAAMMTSADISEAQRRASVCMASNYQDCD